MKKNHQPGCACCFCTLKLEDFPEIEKIDWIATPWVFDPLTCCAEMTLTPSPCIPASIVSKDIDLNTFDYAINVRLWKRLYDNDILPATWDGTTWIPPGFSCPPCRAPFVCAIGEFESHLKIATRFGLMFAPWRIKVRICLQELTCNYGEPAVKIVMTSTYEYKVRTLFAQYKHKTSSLKVRAFDCCSGGFTTISNPPHPDTSSPEFWGLGLTWPCMSAGDATVSFVRTKIFDTMPEPGTISYSEADDPNCEELEPPVDEWCASTTGVSNPTNGADTVICQTIVIDVLTCTRTTTAPCNTLYYYTDTEGIIRCAFIPPIPPKPPDPVCGPHSYTIRKFRYLPSPTSLFCPDPPGIGIAGNYFDFTSVTENCISEPPCPASTVRLADTWQEVVSLSAATFCSGGTYEELCLGTPTWTFDIV